MEFIAMLIANIFNIFFIFITICLIILIPIFIVLGIVALTKNKKPQAITFFAMSVGLFIISTLTILNNLLIK